MNKLMITEGEVAPGLIEIVLNISTECEDYFYSTIFLDLFDGQTIGSRHVRTDGVIHWHLWCTDVKLILRLKDKMANAILRFNGQLN